MSLSKVVQFSQSPVRGAIKRYLCALPPNRIGVIGAPFEKGQRKPGVSEGPAAIRKTGLISRLVELGHDITDYGDVRDDNNVPYSTGPDGERDFERVLRYNERLAAAVKQVCQDHRVCVTLGGDHSIGIGSISGHYAALQPNQQLSVLWVDAHADLNTGQLSQTGNMHGMSLSFVVNNMVKNVMESKFPGNCVDQNNLAYIGLRDVDAAEEKLIKSLGIRAFYMKDVDKLGIKEVMAQCLNHLQPQSEDRSLHVSFDIDVMDPIVAPATGTPVLGGLTVREGYTLMESINQYIKVLDMVEVNSNLSDSRGSLLTARTASSLIMTALAGHRGT